MTAYDPDVECLGCKAQFDSNALGEAKACPSCGSKQKPKLIGPALLAQELIDEYLVVKERVLYPPRQAIRVPGAVAISAEHLKVAESLTHRQLAGMLLRVYGRGEAVKAFDDAPAPTGCRYLWPLEVRELLVRAEGKRPS